MIFSHKKIGKNTPLSRFAMASEFTTEQLSQMFDLSNIEPGSHTYAHTYVARYISLGGELPTDDIIALLKLWVRPMFPGRKPAFPGVGLTTRYTQDQAQRCDTLLSMCGWTEDDVLLPAAFY